MDVALNLQPICLNLSQSQLAENFGGIDGMGTFLGRYSMRHANTKCLICLNAVWLKEMAKKNPRFDKYYRNRLIDHHRRNPKVLPLVIRAIPARQPERHVRRMHARIRYAECASHALHAVRDLTRLN
jgi:hypothetical protein